MAKVAKKRKKRKQSSTKAAPIPFSKAERRRIMDKWCPVIRKTEWEELYGSQTKVIGQQAKTYGLPMGSGDVNLKDFLHAIHDFLVEHKVALARDREHKATAAESSKEIRRWHKSRAALLELKLARESGDWIPKEDVYALLSIVATNIRGAGEILRQRFNPAAFRVLKEALERIDTAVESKFGSNGNPNPTKTPNS